MTVVAVIVTVLLAAGAALTVIRVLRGPSTLDRIVATDVLLAIVVVALASLAAFTRDATALPILAVLSILGFTGSVSVARFATRKPPNPPTIASSSATGPSAVASSSAVADAPAVAGSFDESGRPEPDDHFGGPS
jgi:multicomponent Na+:H+ antiporter subunit F